MDVTPTRRKERKVLPTFPDFDFELIKEDLQLEENELMQTPKHHSSEETTESNISDLSPFNRTPMRHVRTAVENDDSPGINKNLYENSKSSPSCIEWDFIRPQTSKSIRDAAFRLNKELKEHHMNRHKTKSRKGNLSIKSYNSSPVEYSEIPIEQYKASLDYIKLKLKETFVDITKSESNQNLANSVKEISTVQVIKEEGKDALNLEMKNERDSRKRKMVYHKEVDECSSKRKSKKQKHIRKKIEENYENPLTDSLPNMDNFFNDSFDEVMMTCSQIVEDKLLESSCSENLNTKLNKKQVSLSLPVRLSSGLPELDGDESCSSKFLEDGNDALFLSLDSY